MRSTNLKPKGEKMSSGAPGTGDQGSNEDDNGADSAEEEASDEDDQTKSFAPFGEYINQQCRQTGLKYHPSPSRMRTGTKRRHSSSSAEDLHGERYKRTNKAFKSPSVLAKSDNQSDDDYNEIDLITDLDEGEPDMEEFEERVIIDSEEDEKSNAGSLIIPSWPESLSGDEWQGFDLDNSLFLSDVPYFDEQIGRTDPDVLANEVALYNATSTNYRPSSPIPPRRVRFVETKHPSSASSGTSDVDQDIFPDLFVQQDSLDPTFRRLIENDQDADTQSLMESEGSYWDLGDSQGYSWEDHGFDNDQSSIASGSSSGYETDEGESEGETTDEETLPPSTITRPQSLLRLSSVSSSHERTPLTPLSAPIRRAAPMSTSQRRGPPMGMWIADPKKIVVIINASGKNIIIHPTPRISKVDNSLSTLASSGSNSVVNAAYCYGLTGTINPFDESESDRSYPSSQDLRGPMLGAGTNPMMPGLLHGGPGMEHIFGSQAVGPPEAFYPFISVGEDGLLLEEDDDYYADDYGEGDEHLNIDDFIDYGDGSSDVNEEHEKANDDLTSTTTIDFAASTPKSTPAEPTTAADPVPTTQDFLHHLNRKGVVGAFRKNHDHVKARMRQPTSTTSTYGLPGGIKGGRQAAADKPLSPLRERKASKSLGKNTSSSLRIEVDAKGYKRVKRDV
ncbi:MAG: hypothetical protein Q9187_000405 [Circinaria calcarea]